MTTRRGDAAGANAAPAEVNGHRRKSARLAGVAADTQAVETAAKGSKRARHEDDRGTDANAENAPKRLRGRPRKSVAPAEPAVQEQSASPSAPPSDQPHPEPPKKRTRKSARVSKAGAMTSDEATVAAEALGRADEGAEAGSAAGDARLPKAPSNAAGDAAVLPADPLAVAEHHLLPQAGPVSPVKAAVPAAQSAMPNPAPVQAPESPAAAPRSPQPRNPLPASPQRRVLGAANTMATASGGPPLVSAVTGTSTRPVLSPRQAQGAGSPKAIATTGAAAAATAQPAVIRPEGALTDADINQIRRLLMPGALAGTLATCAAATDASGDLEAGPAVGGVGAAGSGPAAGAAAVEPAGRVEQFSKLYVMASECCKTGRGCSVYISGLPGTGKTYTVSRLLAALPGLASASSCGDAGVSICCATINCMTLDLPAQLYGRLQMELVRAAAADTAKGQAGQAADLPNTPANTSSDAAHKNLLDKLKELSVIQQAVQGGAAGSKAAKAGSTKSSRGTKRGRSGAADSAAPRGDANSVSGLPSRRVFVVVLDEVDRLMRRRDGAEELARLFQLPAESGLPIVLLAVANSLDLTERLLPLLGGRVRHMVFTAYTRPQIMAIMAAQLSVHPRGRRCFDDAALDMVAKSVSSSSGDLRQALKACRTALDVLLDHNRANPAAARASVGIREVHTALQRLSAQGNGQSAVVAKIKGLPPQQQLVLLALATAVGAKAAAANADGGGGTTPGGCFQPGCGVFTGSRPKFADTVAFREIGNSQVALGAANNPGACFDGPTPSKAGRPTGAAAPAATPSASRVRGVTGPGGAATPSSCGRGPPSRTPASILAGDAGLALGLPDVYVQYVALCRQLDIPAMSESAFRTDALPGLDCDGLLRVTEGRTPAATRLSLRTMVRDVQSALADNVMFKRLMGARPPAPPGPPVQAAAAGAAPLAVRV